MKKKLSLFLAMNACVTSMSMTALAKNSPLDVSPGDENSFWTIKDDGETNYYITVSSFVGGTIKGISICENGVGTPYYRVIRNAKGTYKVRYGCDVYPTKNYQLRTYGEPSTGWHLTGVYCP